MSRGSAQSFTLAGAAASATSKVGHSSRTANMSRCNGDSDLPMSANLNLPSFPGQAARSREPAGAQKPPLGWDRRGYYASPVCPVSDSTSSSRKSGKCNLVRRRSLASTIRCSQPVRVAGRL
jgi:hypothetical protein